MNEQDLQRANAINARLVELKEHLASIEYIEKDTKQDKEVIRFSISSGDGILEENLEHSFLPINPEDFMRDYKTYLQNEIEKYQQEFQNL